MACDTKVILDTVYPGKDISVNSPIGKFVSSLVDVGSTFNEKREVYDLNLTTVEKTRDFKMTMELDTKYSVSDNIKALPKNHIFVFGSNKGGFHGSGAALKAKTDFGAVTRRGEGEVGQSYALPTKETPSEKSSLESVKTAVDVFIKHAANNLDKVYIVTQVGTGLAGFTADEIAPLFNETPDNVRLPLEWKEYGRKFSLKSETSSLDKTYKTFITKNEQYFADEKAADIRRSEDVVTNHSGGAKGSDYEFGDRGKKKGIHSNHYYIEQKDTKIKPKYANKPLTKSEYIEATGKATSAGRSMGRLQETYFSRDPRILRNWNQVKYSDGIFAIAQDIVGKGDTTYKIVKGEKVKGNKAKISQVLGGTGYAVQMALEAGDKDIYVFNQEDNEWYEATMVDGEPTFTETTVPDITQYKNFAGIGTREINDDGKAAIDSLYSKLPDVGVLEDILITSEEIKETPTVETTTETTETKKTDTKKKGTPVKVDSYQKGLAFALTNPTSTNPMTLEPWGDNRGDKKLREKLEETGIYFKGQKYIDLELAYKENKKYYPTTKFILMKQLMYHKLNKNPWLVDMIDNEGGIDYLNRIVHRPTKRSSPWTTPRNSKDKNAKDWFKKALIAAYKDIKKGVLPKTKTTAKGSVTYPNKKQDDFEEPETTTVKPTVLSKADKAISDKINTDVNRKDIVNVDWTKVTEGKMIYTGRVNNGGAKYAINAKMTTVKNFGNPFVAKGVSGKGMNVRVPGLDTVEDVSVAYYKWVKNNIIPEGYAKAHKDADVKLLAERRTWILYHLDQISGGKEVGYNGNIEEINHVMALVQLDKEKFDDKKTATTQESTATLEEFADNAGFDSNVENEFNEEAPFDVDTKNEFNAEADADFVNGDKIQLFSNIKMPDGKHVTWNFKPQTNQDKSGPDKPFSPGSEVSVKVVGNYKDENMEYDVVEVTYDGKTYTTQPDGKRPLHITRNLANGTKPFQTGVHAENNPDLVKKVDGKTTTGTFNIAYGTFKETNKSKDIIKKQSLDLINDVKKQREC